MRGDAAHRHGLVNQQGGVALTADANDSLAMVVGSGPCVPVTPRPAAIALYRIGSPVSVFGVDLAGELLDCLAQVGHGDGVNDDGSSNAIGIICLM
jgi:hypothetical protein